MPVHNSEVAGIFDHVADLLEIQGANPFRVRAYRNAASTIRDLSRSLSDMLDEGEDLSELPDIGEDLAGKIEEIVETGHLGLLKEISEEVPEALAEVTAVPGIGPKRARKLFEDLGVRSLDDLRKAAKEGRIAEISGFGKKTQKRIRDELARGGLDEHRFRLATAEEFAEPLLKFVKGIDGVRDAVVAGSYRRRKETVGDLDILVTAKDGSAVIEEFTGYDEVDEIVSKGKTRSTVILRSGLQVDLRVVPEESYGAAMHYFTGSKSHNIACRKRAVNRGLKLNEYGLFEDDERVAGSTEEDVYEAIGLPMIPPVLRESRGEIEAAEKGELPELVTLEDVRGDLHAHTDASDGRATLREMAAAAKERGYDYLAITDHSKGQMVANGLDEKRLRKQLDAIEELNAQLEGIQILKSSEVDILPDGRLDFPDSVLRELDLVVASVHGKFDLDEETQTERIIRAMDNAYVSIIGHPTGRLIGERRPYDLNVEKLVEAARARGCHLELNAHPMRLDLNDVQCRMAKDLGVKIAISTDAHSTGELLNMRYGIAQAQRGWLEPGDVLNTRKLSDLKKLLARG
jgi:DNA polymerase (family 10)